MGPPTPLHLPHCGVLQLSIRALCRVSENGHSFGGGGREGRRGPPGKMHMGQEGSTGNSLQGGGCRDPPSRDGAPAVGGIGGHPQEGAAGYGRTGKPPGAGALQPPAKRDAPAGLRLIPSPFPPSPPGSPRSAAPYLPGKKPPTPPLCANGERPPAVPAAARGYGAAPAPGEARGGTAGTGCSQPPPASCCPTRRKAPRPPPRALPNPQPWAALERAGTVLDRFWERWECWEPIRGSNARSPRWAL